MQILKILIIALIFFFQVQNTHAQCDSNEHGANFKDSWLSCQHDTNNSGGDADYAWISYDFGYPYALGKIHIWNYNVLNETSKGMKEAEVYYSNDRENWTFAAAITVPEADASEHYNGWEGPDLGGIQARYALIRILNNWEGSECCGFSEIRFNISEKTTSIKANQLAASKLSLYPNPSQQILNIHLEDAAIQEVIFMNNTGHELMRKSAQKVNGRIDIMDFPAGMYYVKVITKTQKYVVKKFVKVSTL